MTLQFGASLTDDASSVNYDCNMFIIQATGQPPNFYQFCLSQIKCLDYVLHNAGHILKNIKELAGNLTGRSNQGPFSIVSHKHSSLFWY